MSKKIMQINITCGAGSTGRISSALYHASEKQGYSVSFAYSAFSPAIKEAFRIENKFQNYLRRGLNRYFGCKQKHSKLGTKRLIRFIKKEKPELIHVHNVQQNAVDYRLFFDFLKKSGIPIVFTLHDCWSFTGGCYHFTEKGCNGYISGCKNCSNYKKHDDVTIAEDCAYEIKKQLIGENDNIHPVCVSNWLRMEATKSYMGKMKNVPTTIYNGIDTQTFCPKENDKKEKLGISNEELVILGVASYWGNGKGLPLFIEIAKKIDFPIKVVLIGSGLEKVKLLNDSRFICIDRTESVSKLAEIYSLADVFINTSIEETFGLTTAEALSCGTPAIVFNSTACPEVIDEKTGITVEKGVDNVVSAIKEIREKGKTYYSENCRKRVLDNFSLDKMTDDYLNLYGELIND